MRQVIHPQEATIQFIRYNTGKKTYTLTTSVLPHDNHPFYSVCRNGVQCGESPTAGFYANFGGDPFTDHPPHDRFMRSVFFRMSDRTASFMPQWLFIRSVHDRTPGRAPVCDES